MRTLIFCTAYAQTPLIWQRRYRRWVDTVLASRLGDQVLLVDDGSPVLPGWSDTDIVTMRSSDDAKQVESNAPIVLLRFPDHLGRKANYDFPGWHRSFACAAGYAAAQSFNKAIHIESDAYVISDRLNTWLRDTQSGWHTLWSRKYDFPEIAIQSIAGEEIASLEAFMRRPYAEIIALTHESVLPYTHVEKSFVGDRYGEDEIEVPANADFATQIPAQREPSYYWWLNGASGPPASEAEPLTFRFSSEDAGARMLGDGWAKPEPKGTWMTHAFSVLALPALPVSNTIDMVFAAAPHVQPDVLPVQRLSVQVNTQMVGHFEFPNALIVGCEIPGRILRRDGTDKIRFLHPDGASPAQFRANEKRVLALMLLRLSLQPRGGNDLPD